MKLKNKTIEIAILTGFDGKSYVAKMTHKMEVVLDVIG